MAMVTDDSDVCKKYLITGGDGFIGVNLSKFLISRGDYVHIIDNNITSNPVFEHNRLSRTICEVENFSVDQINNFISMNLTSHLIITKGLLPHFKKIKKGDIIFIGSEAGLSGAKNGSLYCSSKFGLRGFAQSLSKDVASNNIRVCIINAGMVRTNFFENLNFLPGDDLENAISVDDISNSVANILTLNRNTVVDEINLSPAKKVVKFK